MLEVTSKPTPALIVLASMPKLAPKLVENVFEPVPVIVMVLVTVFFAKLVELFSAILVPPQTCLGPLTLSTYIESKNKGVFNGL